MTSLLCVVLHYRDPAAWPIPVYVGAPARAYQTAHKLQMAHPADRVTVYHGGAETPVGEPDNASVPPARRGGVLDGA